MKQVFSKKEHESFKKYLNIKNSPQEFDNFYIGKTKRYIKFIKWIPGIKMIGIGNSISMNAGKKESDIDLYIVSNEKMMWFVRIFITIIFWVLGVRKNEKKHEGRFCLSFFSTLKGMNFSNFKLENDIYLYFWIIYFKPILNYNNTYDKFISINSEWADFSEYKDIIKKNKNFIKYKRTLKKESKNKILKYLNNILKKIFLPKTLKHYEKIGKPFGIIINDTQLKFHNGDIRKKIKEELL